MSECKRDMARHALGLPNKRNLAYRNYYETSEGGQDQFDWQDMVYSGLAVQNNETMFHVSLDGIQWALDMHEAIIREDMGRGDVVSQQLKHIHALEAELKQKDEKLSEFQEGIPIEKAKKLDQVIIMDWEKHSSDGKLWSLCKPGDAALVKWAPIPTCEWGSDDEWFDEWSGTVYLAPKKFYPLPPTETGGE